MLDMALTASTPWILPKPETRPSWDSALAPSPRTGPFKASSPTSRRPREAFRLTLGLEQAHIRTLDDHQQYDFTALLLTGALPGFWKFTTVEVDLGVGLHSTMQGAHTLTGTVMLARIF